MGHDLVETVYHSPFGTPLERERLLGGNWKIQPAAGLYFKREWCAVVDEIPADLDVVRYWDLATTEKTEFNANGTP
jgi:hypothetical protein